MKKISWLEDFAASRKKSATEQKTTVASKKVAKKSIASADMIIIAKSMLPKAVNGNTVKYQNVKWKVVNASYKDAKGEWHTTTGQKPQPFLEPALLDNE